MMIALLSTSCLVLSVLLAAYMRRLGVREWEPYVASVALALLAVAVGMDESIPYESIKALRRMERLQRFRRLHPSVRAFESQKEEIDG